MKNADGGRKKNQVTKMKVKTNIKFNDVELKIIRLICREFSNEEIGKKLGYSTRTIEKYRLVINKKMKVRNALGIFLYALRHGIIKVKS